MLLKNVTSDYCVSFCSHPANYRRAALSLVGNKQPQLSSLISICSSVSLRWLFPCQHHQFKLARGSHWIFFSRQKHSNSDAHSCGAQLSSVSLTPRSRSANKFRSRPRPHLHVERAESGLANCDRAQAPITVIKVPSGAHQPASYRRRRTPIFSSKTQHAGARRDIEFRTLKSNWCGSEKNYFQHGHCVRRASHQTHYSSRVCSVMDQPQESRFGSHSCFGSPRQQSASPASSLPLCYCLPNYRERALTSTRLIVERWEGTTTLNGYERCALFKVLIIFFRWFTSRRLIVGCGRCTSGKLRTSFLCFRALLGFWQWRGVSHLFAAAVASHESEAESC